MGPCLSFDDKSMVSGRDGGRRVVVLMDKPVANPGVCSKWYLNGSVSGT